MILYDEKLNFLGMSEHTLSFLGYEDIADFTSMNNDVADLFIKKEGYIYKFDNFSWIDFILYSGSATKKAIIRLKNGQETPIDITIKEIFLQNNININDNKKLYSVRLISDNFHKISGVQKETTGAVGGFSLNHLINGEDSKNNIIHDTPKIDKPKEISQPVSTNINKQNSTNFILDDIDDQQDKKQELYSKPTIEDKQTITSQIKETGNVQALDFLNTKTEEEITPIIEPTPEKETSTGEFSIDLFKTDATPEVVTEQKKEEQKSPPPLEPTKTLDDGLSLNFLKADATPPTETKKIEDEKPLGFLNVKQETEKIQTVEPVEKEETENKKSTLNFLKADATPQIETEKEEKKKSPPPLETTQKLDLDFLKADAPPSVETKKMEDEKPLGFLNIQQDEEKIQTVKPVQKKETSDTKLTLDFLKADSVEPTQSENKQEKKSPPSAEPVQKLDLDFLKADSTPQIETKNVEQEQPLGFLNINQDEDVTPKVEPEQKEEPPENEFTIDFLQENTTPKVAVKELEDEQALDFLNIKKIKDTPPPIEIVQMEPKITNEKTKLSFLDTKTTDSQNIDSTAKLNTSTQIDKSNIIKQIKEDIKEIDASSEKPDHDMIFRQTKQNSKDQEDIKEDFTKTDFHISQTQESTTNNSFVNTLKSLFNEKESKQIDKDEDILDDTKDKVFSFKLKQNDSNEIKISEKSTPSKMIKKVQTLKSTTYPSLKSLGLDPEQEKDLISDFVIDAKESMHSIKYFIEIKDFDKIKYSLVKIKSSAEILNLDDIIATSNTMKSNCEGQNVQQIMQDHIDLSNQIKLLEQHLLKIIV